MSKGMWKRDAVQYPMPWAGMYFTCQSFKTYFYGWFCFHSFSVLFLEMTQFAFPQIDKSHPIIPRNEEKVKKRTQVTIKGM